MESIIQIQRTSEVDFFKKIEKLIDEKLEPIINSNNNEKLSIKDVALELGCAELTIHNYIKKGILPAYRLGRRVFIKRIELDEALTEVKSLRYKR